MHRLKSYIKVGLIVLLTMTILSSSSTNSQETVRPQPVPTIPSTIDVDTQVVNKVKENLNQFINESKKGKKLSKSIQIESQRVPKVKVKTVRIYTYPEESKVVGDLYYSVKNNKDSIVLVSDSTYLPLHYKDSIKSKPFWSKIKGWFSKSK